EAVAPGQSILHIQPGGGGYGNPLERPASSVLEDILDEKLTTEFARVCYGVVLTAAGDEVDGSATDALRVQMADIVHG
ncbi:MAG: hydantoinase B/oxoprolinase family protein, partial [Chromatiales bacterium]|nr:hydantoinase B/oxoprolinase family protein [Chromatiales bacterium]